MDLSPITVYCLCGWREKEFMFNFLGKSEVKMENVNIYFWR